MVLPFLRKAWQAGVFKTVKGTGLRLDQEEDRDLLIDGVVSSVESIRLCLSNEAPQVERAALKDMSCTLIGEDLVVDVPGLPPFIPTSLETLTLSISGCTHPVLLLGHLPPMIESSGAKLRCLNLRLDQLDDEETARRVGTILQVCASTLKDVKLEVDLPFESAPEVAEGLASCPHLERLTAPISTFAVVPPGPSVSFPIVHLRLSCKLGEDDTLSSISGNMLWELTAQGGFPSLTFLHIALCDWNLGAELGPVMVAAFEGVAGTLKTLKLEQEGARGEAAGAEGDDVLWPLSEAISKLRRLETLTLRVEEHGLGYHRIAQGMPEGACPALRSLTFSTQRGAAWLACQPSIILPSVRQLGVSICYNEYNGVHDPAEALALACA
jgi:hypothetical protein